MNNFSKVQTDGESENVCFSIKKTAFPHPKISQVCTRTFSIKLSQDGKIVYGAEDTDINLFGMRVKNSDKLSWICKFLPFSKNSLPPPKNIANVYKNIFNKAESGRGWRYRYKFIRNESKKFGQTEVKSANVCFFFKKHFSHTKISQMCTRTFSIRLSQDGRERRT